MMRCPTARLLGLACLGALLSASAHAEDVDLLSETEAPGSAEIAATIARISVQTGRIDIPPPERIEIIDPRSLRQEVEEDEQTTISLSADVLFGFDEDALTPRAEQVVRSVAEERLAGTAGPVQVIGHTDSIGEEAYNQDLSERRAESVAAVLSEVLGAEREIEQEGRSFHDPVAEDTRPDGEDDPEGRARNRRVEIVFSNE
ncbi:OmpA family protein [Glycocaulis profundi]|nr:OmpA family protein [Glycocaulis profundi]